MADQGALVEFAKGQKIISLGGEDNDIYLLVAGDVSIVIKGNEYTTRKAGQHVGEMAAIEPSQKRSANVVVHDTVVALKLSNPAVHEARAELPADLASTGARAFTAPLSEE